MEDPAMTDVTGIMMNRSAPSMDAPLVMPKAQDQRDFAEIFGRRTSRQYATDDPARARDAAENFVSIALVQPVFKQMREANHAPPPFGPNKAEQQFQSLVDAQVARKMVRSSHWPLVDRVARDLLKHTNTTAS